MGDLRGDWEVRRDNSLRSTFPAKRIGDEGDAQEVDVAIALGSDEEDDIKVIAAARGDLAKRIIAKAKEEGVPIERDPELAEELSKVRIGESIPENLYDLVASLINFTWKLDEDLKRKIKRKLREIEDR